MNSGYLLQRCEHIAAFSALMVDAAREDNWREVDRLQATTAVAIEEIRALSRIVALTAAERRAKLESMQRILVNDGRIREMAEPTLWNPLGRLPTGNPAAVQCGGIPR